MYWVASVVQSLLLFCNVQFNIYLLIAQKLALYIIKGQKSVVDWMSSVIITFKVILVCSVSLRYLHVTRFMDE